MEPAAVVDGDVELDAVRASKCVFARFVRGDGSGWMDVVRDWKGGVRVSYRRVG